MADTKVPQAAHEPHSGQRAGVRRTHPQPTEQHRVRGPHPHTGYPPRRRKDLPAPSGGKQYRAAPVRRQAATKPYPRRGQPFLTRLKGEFKLLSFLRFLVILILLVGVLSLGFSLYLKEKYRYDILSIDGAAAQTKDAVLVFGCGVYHDGSPTPMLQERMDAGIRAYFKGAGHKLLLSGDHGQKNYDEVNAMKNIAMAQGVPEQDIFLDHAGFSTYESLKRAKDIYGVKSLCLVTQTYHLYRALYLADSLGLEYSAVSADGEKHAGQIWRELREVLARVKDIYNATFEPHAEIMGERIDIHGDGRVSFD